VNDFVHMVNARYRYFAVHISSKLIDGILFAHHMDMFANFFDEFGNYC